MVGLQMRKGRGMDKITRAYADAVGRWIGCDWQTSFGPRQLDLQGLTATHAVMMAQATGGVEAEAWREAARWLLQVEHHAREAEAEARAAVVWAESGDWQRAGAHARRACELEGAYTKTF